MLIQYHGNDLRALGLRLCALLRRRSSQPLQAEPILVPNLGIARWLEQFVAEQLGIAANLGLELPQRFIEHLAADLLGETDIAQGRHYAKDALALRLLRLLPPALERPQFAALRGYLGPAAEQRRVFALCRRIATLYDNYLLYRPEWLLGWERGANDPGAGLEAWQPMLWRDLVADIAAGDADALHGAARLRALLDRLHAQANPGESLPPRIIGFGLGSMPPLLLAVLNAAARYTDVQLFQFNPCREYWGEIVDERVLARWRLSNPARAELAEVGNALLARWGTLGRENLESLLEATQGEVEDTFVASEQATVLASIQNDILDLHTPSTRRELGADDRSLVFAEVHSELRELEVLHDQLLQLFETLPGLRPRDVVVMAPDIAKYCALIAAVFEEARGTTRFIPYTIADRSPAEESPLVSSFLHLLDLPLSRFRASEVLALLAVPAVAERFGFDADELATLQIWVRESGIRWGLGRDSANPALPRLCSNSWDFGLSRMLLGVALEDGALYAASVALDLGGNEAAGQIGKLAAFVETLEDYAAALTGGRAIDDWVALLTRMITDFYSESRRHGADVALLRAALAETAAEFELAGMVDPVGREMLADMLGTRLAQREASHAFLGGGVNFCQLAPLRSIPFRVVCAIGMNAVDFPRRTEPAGFDLMARERRRGDPSRRDDDRYLFLEALLCARDQFYLSYIARDERNDAPREASLPLLELRAYIDEHWSPTADMAGASACFERKHRLKPFHEDYFRAGSSLFSYREQWLGAANLRQVTTEFCAKALQPVTVESLGVANLLAFFRNPCRAFFSERLGLRFLEPAEMVQDGENLTLDSLAGYRLKTDLAQAALEGRDEASIMRRWLAAGELPHGAPGRLLLEQSARQLRPLGERIAAWQQRTAATLAVDLDIDGARITGTLGNLRGSRILMVHASRQARGNLLVPFWISQLLASAMQAVDGPAELHDLGHVYRLPLFGVEAAREQLRTLLEVYREGMCKPLPLFAKTSYEWTKERVGSGDAVAAMGRARREFLDSGQSTGESADVYVRRAWPLPEQALGEEFTGLAIRVFGPLLAVLEESSA